MKRAAAAASVVVAFAPAAGAAQGTSPYRAAPTRACLLAACTGHGQVLLARGPGPQKLPGVVFELDWILRGTSAGFVFFARDAAAGAELLPTVRRTFRRFDLGDAAARRLIGRRGNAVWAPNPPNPPTSKELATLRGCLR